MLSLCSIYFALAELTASPRSGQAPWLEEDTESSFLPEGPELEPSASAEDLTSPHRAQRRVSADEPRGSLETALPVREERQGGGRSADNDWHLYYQTGVPCRDHPAKGQRNSSGIHCGPCLSVRLVHLLSRPLLASTPSGNRPQPWSVFALTTQL